MIFCCFLSLFFFLWFLIFLLVFFCLFVWIFFFFLWFSDETKGWFLPFYSVRTYLTKPLVLNIPCLLQVYVFPSEEILEKNFPFLWAHILLYDFPYPKYSPAFSRMRAAFPRHLGKYSVISWVSYNCLSFVTHSLENCCLTVLVQT